MYTTLIPAYGRDYKSKKAVLADWNAEKDFLIQCFHSPDDGRYINRQQTSSKDRFEIRYSKLTKCIIVEGGIE